MTRVAINGLGRIGRCFLRTAWGDPSLEIVAINDVGNIDNVAYLLKHDSVYRTAPFEVSVANGKLVIDGKEITCVSEREPSKLPWKDLNIDVVVESTGIFDSYEMANAHVTAGAKRVVITAPVKDEMAGAACRGEQCGDHPHRADLRDHSGRFRQSPERKPARNVSRLSGARRASG